MHQAVLYLNILECKCIAIHTCGKGSAAKAMRIGDVCKLVVGETASV
jgi:hypothetical protein